MLDELLSFWQAGKIDAERDSAAEAVRGAVQEDSAWGFAFAREMRRREIWNAELWKSVIRGWNQPGPGSGQWPAVLRLLADCPAIVSVAAREIALLLERGISGDLQPIEGPHVGDALKLGMQVWSVLASQQEQPLKEAEEWLTVAVNRSAGILMEFELRALWQLKKEAGSSWRGLPSNLKEHLTSVVNGRSWAAELARVVLASGVYTFFQLDADWTLENVLALFDWKVDPRRAQQAWHGYLVWGRWSEDIIGRFLLYYVQTFPEIGTRLGRFRRQFCEHLAAITLFSTIHPLDSGWLASALGKSFPLVLR